MIIYGSTLSPFVRKTLAFIAEKGLEAEVRPGGLGAHTTEFLEVSPFRKIPALRDGDFTISDSTAIITYIDAKYPEPNLFPTAPEARARTVWYEEFADTIMVASMAKVFFNRVVRPRFLKEEGDMVAAHEAATKEIPPMLDYLEAHLPDSCHLVEDRLTLADLAVASPFVNLSHGGLDVEPDKHPKLDAYVKSILARPSFAGMVAKEKAFLARP